MSQQHGPLSSSQGTAKDRAAGAGRAYVLLIDTVPLAEIYRRLLSFGRRSILIGGIG